MLTKIDADGTIVYFVGHACCRFDNAVLMVGVSRA